MTNDDVGRCVVLRKIGRTYGCGYVKNGRTYYWKWSHSKTCLAIASVVDVVNDYRYEGRFTAIDAARMIGSMGEAMLLEDDGFYERLEDRSEEEDEDDAEAN